MSFYPKCSRKNRKRLKPGSKRGEGTQILLSLSPNSLISKGLLNSHFSQPWKKYLFLVWEFVTVGFQEDQLMVSAFPLATFSWKEMGMFHKTSPCWLLLSEGIKERGLGSSRHLFPFPHCSTLGAQLVMTLGLDFHPQPDIQPLSAQKKGKKKAFVIHKAKEIMGKSASNPTFFYRSTISRLGGKHKQYWDRNP